MEIRWREAGESMGKRWVSMAREGCGILQWDFSPRALGSREVIESHFQVSHWLYGEKALQGERLEVRGQEVKKP